MLSKKMKIFIAGIVTAFIVIVGAGIYLVHKESTISKNELKTQTANNQIKKTPAEKKPIQEKEPEKKQNDNSKNDTKEQSSNNTMKTAPVLNETVNTNQNTNVNNIDYSSLFQSVFGYQYQYPQMVENKDLNFLKSLTLFQIAQVQAMIPYTDSTISTKGSLSQYMQQLKQIKSDTDTLISLVNTLQKNSKDESFVKDSSQFIQLGLEMSTDINSEVSNMNLFNSGYARLKVMPFGANMQKYINEYTSLSNSLGANNADANTWLNKAQNAIVIYQGPLAPTDSIKTSSSTSIKQQ